MAHNRRVMDKFPAYLTGMLKQRPIKTDKIASAEHDLET